jgi:hypothetical protein
MWESLINLATLDLNFREVEFAVFVSLTFLYNDIQGIRWVQVGNEALYAIRQL